MPKVGDIIHINEAGGKCPDCDGEVHIRNEPALILDIVGNVYHLIFMTPQICSGEGHITYRTVFTSMGPTVLPNYRMN